MEALGDWARSEKRTWRQVVELLVGVADGLAAAHAAGILHRDIKPENVLVAKNGYAKLADFGIAKLEDPAIPEDLTRTVTDGRTRPGVIVGTIAYMSPEQALGKPVDARSDIFSFGVVLYELLAGRRPFEGNSDLERLQAIVHRPVPVMRVIAQIVGGQIQPPGLARPLDDAFIQRPREHRGKQSQHVNLHRVARSTSASPRSLARPGSGLATHGDAGPGIGVAVALPVAAQLMFWPRSWRGCPAREFLVGSERASRPCHYPAC